ncbi:two-component regulator propeller domain-containing protein [Paenibacillus sp. SI8]|uniref:hybrid sensor histidine kinase/response regulator n=1 Tax=unclassified Paenibacillus TaxID=185978 RepID=UPI00346604C2
MRKLFQKFKIPIVFVFFIYIALLYQQSVDAQSDSQPYGMKFEHIDTLSSDLSQSSIFNIVQDNSGFLWFATQNGLNRFDGYNFKIYKSNKNDLTSISDNWVNTIFLDKSGVLWIGTLNGGLNKYDEKNDSFLRYTYQSGKPDGISSNLIADVVEDNHGFIWIGTDNGLNRLNPKTGEFKSYHHNPNDSNSLSSDRISDLFMDRDGFLWVATEDGGVNRFDQETEKVITYKNDLHSKNLSDNFVEYIYQDSNGKFWFGTKNGLDQFDPGTAKFKNYINEPNNPNSLSNNYVQYIYEDKEHRLWIGTNQGLNLFTPDEQGFIRYVHDPANINSLSEDNIRSIFQDRSGIIWIGTNSSGINKFSQEKDKFAHFYNKPIDANSLDNNNVWSFYVDKDNQLWVGTSDGLNIYDSSRQKVKHYQHDLKEGSSISTGNVWTIMEDSHGDIYVGTQTGLDRFDRKTEKFIHYRYDLDNGNNLSNIRALYEDKKGTLWIGTKNDGLLSLDPARTTFNQIPNKTLSGSIWITSLMEDRDGSLWVGTNTGLYDLDSQAVSVGSYRQNSNNQTTSISNDRIRSIYEDAAHGMIWIATLGGGLNRLDVKTNSLTTFSEDDGLSNNTIYGILADEEGNLWLSTDFGISKFDPNKLIFKNYDVRNGLQSNEFNGNAYYKSKSGEMFFGGVNGFNAFYASRIKDSSFIPPIHITSLRTKNKVMKCCTEPLHLSYAENAFSAEFASLDYTMPQKNQYAYRLEGFDKNWVYSGDRRFASYTNLDAGRYIFEVKGTNIDGVWSDKQTLEVTVDPPYWKTWWAYTLYVMMAVLIFWTFSWLRSKKHKKDLKAQHIINEELVRMNRLKDDILATTTHELKTPLNGIIGITDSILEGIGGPVNDVVRKNLNLVISNGKRLHALVNNILDLSHLKHGNIQLNLKSLDLSRILDEVIIVSRPLLLTKDIILENKMIEGVFVYGDECRIQQILYNLIGNAVKFTESGRIEVTAQISDQFAEIMVSDTGIGIPQEKFCAIFEPFEQVDGSMSREHGGTGLGLAITKHLVELHHGSIQVESIVGQGSKFTFTLPIADLLNNDDYETIHDEIVQKQIKLHLMQDEIAISRENKSSINQINVLVVDDDPVNLQVMINYFALQDWNLVFARDGLKALDIIESAVIDLVLLDVMMPKVSGFEVCKKIRETYSKEELPVIFLTAKNSPDDLATGFDSGGNDYLTKPFSKYELIARVNGHLKLRLMTLEKQKDEFTKTEKEILTLAYQYPRRELLERFNERREHKIVEKTLESHISKIIKKLGIEGGGIEKGAQLAKKKSII